MRYAYLVVLGWAVSIASAGVSYPEGATTLHFAFEGSPNGDRPIVRPPAFYAADAGFGFVDSPGLIGNANGVQATRYFRYDVNLPPGNYDVAVRVGSPAAASNTTIKSEGHRVMMYDVPTAARGNAVVNFTVNVRASADPREVALDLDGRLTLEFAGENPSMMKLDVKPNTAARTLFILSDDFAADREDVPRAGWGQMLPLFFKPGEVAVANWSYDQANARDAEAKFIARGDVPTAFQKALRPGDYVLIVLSGDDNARPVATQAGYTGTIKSILDEVRKHQAIPLLAMFPERQYINAAGKIVPRQVPLVPPSPEWIKAAAAAEKVPLIDFGAVTNQWVQGLEPRNALAVFSEEDPKTLNLQQHLSAYGAFEYARLMAMALRDGKVELAAHLYPEIPPPNGDPKQFPASLGFDYLKK